MTQRARLAKRAKLVRWRRDPASIELIERAFEALRYATKHPGNVGGWLVAGDALLEAPPRELLSTADVCRAVAELLTLPRLPPGPFKTEKRYDFEHKSSRQFVENWLIWFLDLRPAPSFSESNRARIIRRCPTLLRDAASAAGAWGIRDLHYHLRNTSDPRLAVYLAEALRTTFLNEAKP